MVLGIKHDEAKNPLDLLPVKALLEVGRVLGVGAKKYADNNWQHVHPFRYYGAALRHLMAWRVGQKCDDETGLSHLAHAAACVLFLLAGEVGYDPSAEPLNVFLERNGIVPTPTYQKGRGGKNAMDDTKGVTYNPARRRSRRKSDT